MSHLKYGLDDLGSGRKSSHGPGNARAFAQISLALLLAAPIFSVQAELYFNPRFLADDPAAVADLSGFANGQEVPPGTYRVDIYLNDGFMTTRDITFNSSENDRSLVPCLTRGQLAGMGVNTTSIEGIGALASDACVPLTETIKDATTRFDVGLQRLYLTVPQAFMGNRARAAPGACATTPPGATAAAAVRRPMKTSGSTSIPGWSATSPRCARV